MLDHAITLGEVLIASAVVVGVIVVISGLVWIILSILAKGMSR